MGTLKVSSIGLLSLWLACCLSLTSCQQEPPINKLEADSQRWKVSGDDIVLLVRKVDDYHPYFKSLLFRKSRNGTENLLNLTKRIAEHCNTTNITQLVKNDILVLLSAADGNELASGDRIEAWSVKSGNATRAKTILAFAKPREAASIWIRPPKPPRQPSQGGGGSGGNGGSGGSGGSGAHHGGGRRRKYKRGTPARISARDFF